MRRLQFALCFLLLFVSPALAQTNVLTNFRSSTGVATAVSPSNPLPVTGGGGGGGINVTPTDCSGSIISGGTAQNAFSAQISLHGFTIVNIDTTEPLWFSMTTTAAASGAGSYPLAAATATTFSGAGSFTTPSGLGTNHAMSVFAATTNHKWSCTWW